MTFGNDRMGSLLVVKKDAVTGAPISDVEFFITDSDGSVIGNANGKYVTDILPQTVRIEKCGFLKAPICHAKKPAASEVGATFRLERIRP